MNLWVLIIQMAWRNLWRQRRRTLLVMGTAIAGVVGIQMYMGFLNGLQRMMVQGAIESGLGHVQVRPSGYLDTRKSGMILPKSAALLNVLNMISTEKNHSISASSRLEKEGMVRIGTYQRGINVIGVDVNHEKEVSSFHHWLQEGSYLKKFLNEDDAKLGIYPVMIGRALAREMELLTGETFVLTLATRSGLSKSVLVRIAGVFSAISDSIDLNQILMRQADLSEIVYGKKSPVVTEYLILSVKNSENEKVSAQNLQALLSGDQRLKKEDSAIEIATYYELQPGIARMMEFSKQFSGIFNLVLLAGFALTLLNAVLMSVFERTREIGVLRAIGTKGTQLMSMFLFEAFFIAFIGVTIGSFIAVPIVFYFEKFGLSLSAFARGMQMMNTGSVVYPYITPTDMLITYVMGVGVSLLAVLYPVRVALKLTPVRAIYNR